MARSYCLRAGFIGVMSCLGLSLLSCQPQTPLSASSGNVKVLIPMVAKDLNNDSSRLEVVTIKNITTMKDVSGSYVKFYYTPGSAKDGLTGMSPQSHFIRTNDDVYVPADTITQQMASLYYHIQSLNDFNAEISPELKQIVPFQIGLQTQVPNKTFVGLNNAFFDGDSNALLFVPYTLENIPISVNSGIIAHEFFHSIFFKKVLKSFTAKQTSLVENSTDKAAATKVMLLNQTYIRGLNEGLADFWGWLYTNNYDYISISLPKFGGDRKLTLDESFIGRAETASDIEDQVNEAQQLSKNPTEYLSSYIYHIGTPHARFLKSLTDKMNAENKLVVIAPKLAMGRAIYSYLKLLSEKSVNLNAKDLFATDDLFIFFAQPKLSGLEVSADQCDFILKYVVTKDKDIKAQFCKGSKVP